MPQLAYRTVDVFTTTRFGGNPLAVVLDARSLDAATMQRVAREFNYSESTFVLPPDDAANTARVRIFTPTGEVPFAGHPNVGTAFVLAQQGELFGQPLGDAMRFEEGAGLVDVAISRAEDGRVIGAAITAPRNLELGPAIPVELVAGCASLRAADVVPTPRVVSVGLPFAVAQLASREALARAKPNLERFAEAAAAFPHPTFGFSLFLFVPTAGTPNRYDTRMFAPLDNVPEDPATGSASAALAAYLVSLDPAPEVDRMLLMEQGVDIGRPSLLRLTVRKAAGVVQHVIIEGDCVPVMQGIIEL